MQEKHIKAILLVTGIITMLPLMQYLLPGMMLAKQGLSVGDDTGLFFARHWGFVVFCFGAMLVYASKRPTYRAPIIIAAGAEKLGLIALIALNWDNPALQGLHLSALFDGVCIILYLLILRPAFGNQQK